MHRFLCRTFVTLSLLLITPTVHSLPLAKGCDLKLRTFVFPPLAMKDSNNNWIGTDLDYTKALLDKVGCRFNIVITPWGRGIEMLKQGRVDLMLNVSWNAERAKRFHYVGPHRTEIIRLVSKKGSLPLIHSWRQLETIDATLMRQRGSDFGEQFNNMLVKNPNLKSKLIELANNEVRLNMIRKGRATGFFADSAYIEYQIKTNPEYAILEMHPLIIRSNPVYFAFSKKSLDEDLMKKINKAFAELAKTDTLKTIDNKY